MPAESSGPDSLSTREVELLQELDRIRDNLSDDGDPQAMFEALTHTVRDWLHADGCAILLVAETSDDIECLACNGIPEPVAIDHCQMAMSQPGITTLETAAWSQAVGVQIILDTYPLGSLILVRNEGVFSSDDLRILKLIEDQLDSAVMQARVIWKLAQRNRELEAIYALDRLRDEVNSEADLISGFTTLALQQFEAELCVILLASAEDNEPVIRGLVDKNDIPFATLEAIRHAASGLDIAQVIPTPEGISRLTLLAAPLTVGRQRLGAIVVGRPSPFTIPDHRLLHAMMTQMDSAVVHARTILQLAQRRKELEIIYRIDHIRDVEKDFDAMLQSVLKELCQAVTSELGYIMLYSQDDEEMELRAFTQNNALSQPDYMNAVQHYSRQALREARLVYANQLQGPVRSIVAIPLILNDRIIGVFGLVNSLTARGFGAEDRRILAAITSQVDTAIFERLEQRRMRSLLSRSVDPKVVDHLLQRANPNVLYGERVIISVLFADLRGSTEWAERTTPEELVNTINLFLARMTDVLFEYGGTLDKFVGDQVICLFGTPVPMEDHAFQAASAALEMQRAHIELQGKLRQHGRELPDMGIGVSSGEAIAGEMGHPIRSEFTAMGHIVNLGSRLCGAAAGGQILISKTTREMLGRMAQIRELDPMPLKGISQPAQVFELISAGHHTNHHAE